MKEKLNLKRKKGLNVATIPSFFFILGTESGHESSLRYSKKPVSSVLKALLIRMTAPRSFKESSSKRRGTVESQTTTTQTQSPVACLAFKSIH